MGERLNRPSMTAPSSQHTGSLSTMQSGVGGGYPGPGRPGGPSLGNHSSNQSMDGSFDGGHNPTASLGGGSTGGGGNDGQGGNQQSSFNRLGGSGSKGPLMGTATGANQSGTGSLQGSGRFSALHSVLGSHGSGGGVGTAPS